MKAWIDETNREQMLQWMNELKIKERRINVRYVGKNIDE